MGETRRVFLAQAVGVAFGNAMLGNVMVHAGRRVDAADAKATRFPLANVDKVRTRIADALAREKPSAVVSAAACGSDLLLLDVARTLHIERTVLLAAPPEQFRKSSVIDRPGNWGAMFDQLLQEVKVEVVSVPAGDTGYLETNLKLIARAESLAAKQKTSVTAIVVWDGKSRGPDDVTGHFLEQAKLRKLRVLEISTL